MKYCPLWELRVGKYRVFYSQQKERLEILAVVLLGVDEKKDLHGNYPEYLNDLSEILNEMNRR